MKRVLWGLIKKDICLCPEWLILGVFLTLLMPAYVIYSVEISNVFYEPLFILCAICSSNVVIQRICYIEDNQAVKNLLSSLPVTRKQLVKARYLMASAMLIAFVALSEMTGLICGITINAIVGVLGVTIGIIYEGLYLFFYYRCGSNVAQNSSIIFFVLSAFVGWYLLTMEALFNCSNSFFIVILMISIGLYATSAKLSMIT